MEVIVVGGGIGGLSLALSLRQAGIAVRVYEAVGEIGAAWRRHQFAAHGGSGTVRTWSSRRACAHRHRHAASEPTSTSSASRYGASKRARGRLQLAAIFDASRTAAEWLLLRAARERIGSDNVRSGLRLVSFAQNGDRVSATFQSSGSATSVTDEADILVGADGIHSAVRRQLYPNEGEPRFARQLLWRAAIDAEPFLGGATMIIAGHFDQRIIVYPMGRGARSGQLLTNWVCQLAVSDPSPPREDWNRKADKDRVLVAFDSWRLPWLDMPALIRDTPDIYEFPLVDRDPVPAWSFGRVTLIGDAAHPMHPTGSQAGSQAIVDARTLTAALLSTTDPIEALARYDAERRPAMNEITLRNRRFGPEAAMQLAEERAPDGFVRVEDVVSRQELETAVASFSSAAGLDAERVNSRPSFVPLGARGGA